MSKAALKMGFELCWYEHQAIGLRASISQTYRHWSDEQLLAAQALDAVRVNGMVERADRTLQPGDRVCVWLPEHQEDTAETGWQLLWDDSDLMAVHKPAGLPVSRTTRNLFNTLISLVRRDTQYKHAHLLHRLDAETSGVVLLAKNEQADKHWKKHLDQLLQRKVYHALVWGNPLWEEYHCETWLAEQNGSAIRSRMVVTTEHDENAVHPPKWSRTQFRVLQRFNSHTLLECELFTGRKHQIRAQLAHLGHPIIGDKIYSHDGAFYLKRLQHDLTAEDLARLGAPHHLLHVHAVQLNLGQTVVEITDPHYPPTWQAVSPKTSLPTLSDHPIQVTQ